MSDLGDPIMALDNVSKVFGRADKPVYAARSVSFALHPGRTLALVGESGSGKTTAARLIMREYFPDDGRLLFKGAPLGKADHKALKAYRSAVQMVFQDPFAALNPTHTIRYHLERPLRLHQPGLDGTQRKAAIVELLERVKLDPGQMMPKFPHELSGGDEPTSMLDVSVRQGILNLLNDMKAELKLALLYITHDIATARYVADDIMVMYAGQIVEWGNVDKVLDDPHHPYTRLLLSAVPDPDRRFDDVRFADELNRIDDIRTQSALPQTEIAQAGDNHFFRPLSA